MEGEKIGKGRGEKCAKGGREGDSGEEGGRERERGRKAEEVKGTKKKKTTIDEVKREVMGGINEKKLKEELNGVGCSGGGREREGRRGRG